MMLNFQAILLSKLFMMGDVLIVVGLQIQEVKIFHMEGYQSMRPERHKYVTYWPLESVSLRVCYFNTLHYKRTD